MFSQKSLAVVFLINTKTFVTFTLAFQSLDNSIKDSRTHVSTLIFIQIQTTNHTEDLLITGHLCRKQNQIQGQEHT